LAGSRDLGAPTIKADVCLVAVGRWHAELELDDAAGARFAVGVRVTLADRFGVALGASVVDIATANGRSHVELVGGSGGLTRTLGARHYLSTPWSTIARDVVTDAGETLDPASVTPGTAVRWTRAATMGLGALGALPWAWRVTPAGLVHVGATAYAADSGALPALGYDRDRRVTTCAVDGLSILPRTTRGAVRVEQVRYLVDATARALVWEAEDA
jgi:hypothetical protein